TGFEKNLVKIKLDADAVSVLASQGYQVTDVPARGRVVYLRRTAMTSAGGTSQDVTAIVHPDVREMATLITRAFSLDVAGIDYLTLDIARSYRDGNGAVCEVNDCPGLRTY